MIMFSPIGYEIINMKLIKENKKVQPVSKTKLVKNNNQPDNQLREKQNKSFRESLEEAELRLKSK